MADGRAPEGAGMSLTDERLAEIADYCRVEADDLQLPGFIATAAGYMAGGVCREPERGTLRAEQYIQCIKYLVLDLYDRRDANFVGAAAAENPAFRALMNQLKATEPVSEPDTAGGT